MNYTIKILFVILVLSLSLSCSNGEKDQGVSAAADTTKAVMKNPKEQSKAKSKAPKRNLTPDSYWDGLQAELKIEDDVLQSIQTLNDKTGEKIKVLQSKGGDNLVEKTKEIRLAQREEVKKILGEDLYQKKMSFDKAWSAENTKDFKKMSPNR